MVRTKTNTPQQETPSTRRNEHLTWNVSKACYILLLWLENIALCYIFM